MHHRGVRVFVWLVACAVMAAAAYALLELEARMRAERASGLHFDDASRDLALHVERLRSAQQSYVAEGQGADFWMGRATTTMTALENGLAELATRAGSERTEQPVQAAAGVLAEVREMDRRAREYLRQGQRLTASDLLFSDSLGATTALALSIDTARQERGLASDAIVRELQQRQAYVLAGGAALTLLLALLLVPRVRPPAPQDTREALRALIDTPAAGAALRPELADTPAPPPQPVRTMPAAPAPPPASPARLPPGVDLAGTARVCGDMARLLDPGELPRLLERAAELLHASGVIVWVADGEGKALFPAVTHGYPASLLARMPTIERDDDNAAAAAWRLGEPQTVAATSTAPGALVTPIVTPEGSVGVLAAEVRNGAEARPEIRAIARILAAQLATLVTALPAGQQQTHS